MFRQKGETYIIFFFMWDWFWSWFWRWSSEAHLNQSWCFSDQKRRQWIN